MSGLFGIRALSLPLSDKSIRRAQIAGLLSNLFCDIPFVVVQILTSRYQNTWSVTVSLSFALSCLSILVGITQRLLSYCIEVGAQRRAAKLYVIKTVKAAEKANATARAAESERATASIELPSAAATASLPTVNAMVSGETSRKVSVGSTPPAGVSQIRLASRASPSPLLAGGGGGGTGTGTSSTPPRMSIDRTNPTPIPVPVPPALATNHTLKPVAETGTTGEEDVLTENLIPTPKAIAPSAQSGSAGGTGSVSPQS